MNTLTKSKIMLYLAAIFLAGGVSGAMVSLASARKLSAKAPSMDRACNHMKDRLRAKLDLSPEQMSQIEPILDQTGRELRNVHQHALREVEQVFQRSNAQIAAHLNAGQKIKLEEMEKEHRSFLDKQGCGDKGPPGPPPDGKPGFWQGPPP